MICDECMHENRIVFIIRMTGQISEFQHVKKYGLLLNQIQLERYFKACLRTLAFKPFRFRQPLDGLPQQFESELKSFDDRVSNKLILFMGQSGHQPAKCIFKLSKLVLHPFP